jgi:uncharacterized pyridoxal phosphate-containing UPF0001 family protein
MDTPSMGTSEEFELAIAKGTSLMRTGQVLFGNRA